ncbi:MAG TPA: hypothetical protein VFR18_03395 [Terriglobia bacterium]|nr:hypothetical protein [Terriglobia bacterium]
MNWSLRIRFALLVISLPLIAQAQRTAETLPTTLNDKDFWRMIEDFSEPGGTFRYENFISNERSIQYVIPELKANSKPGGVYLGVAPEQNFTYIAALQPRMAFIVDIRRQNMLVHLLYKALFELSSDRADFVARLFSRKRPAGLNEKSTAVELFDAFERVPGDAAFYGQNLRDVQNVLAKRGYPLSPADLSTIEKVYDVFHRGGPNMNYGFASPAPNPLTPSYVVMMTSTDLSGRSWSYLATEDNFRYVKEMQRKNLIVPLVGDFAGPRVIRNIGRYLKEREATVTAFYVSNVERYLAGPQWQSFYSNVAALPVDASSVFIRFVDNDFTRLLQGWTPGKDVQTGLIPMLELVNLHNAGRLPTYPELLRRQKALP